jgi:heme a synthase
LKAASTPYHPAHHRFAVFIACATFVLIIAGALVTSNDAGLSVPDWPTSYGSYYKLPPWTGGIIYEHSHRMIAEATGALTIAITVWTFLADRRRWMKALALAALGTIIVQGILGGMTVLHFLPPIISSAHAAVGQTFFCIACAIALFTGREWVQEISPDESPRPANPARHPSLLTLALLSLCALYLQLYFGAMFRHHGMGWVPHVVNAPLVALLLTWTSIRALSQYSNIAAIRRPAIAILVLVIVQLCLGFLAFLTRVEWGKDAAQPGTAMVGSTVAHVGVGALLLAATAIFTIQVWRYIPVAVKERIPGGARKPVAA